MRVSAATILAAFVASACAYYPPNTANPPEGNAIYHPGLGELMTAGSPYNITWDPTTTGNISLLLLRGPSTDAQYLLTIVDSTDNTGHYVWTPPTSLVPDTSEYGVEIVCQGTGQYQYSPQCGIANPSYSSTSSMSAQTTITMTLSPGVNATATYSYASASSKASTTSAANATVIIVTDSGSPTAAASTTTTALSTTTTAFSSATVAAQPTAPTGAAVAEKVVNLGGMLFAGLVGAVIV